LNLWLEDTTGRAVDGECGGELASAGVCAIRDRRSKTCWRQAIVAGLRPTSSDGGRSGNEDQHRRDQGDHNAH
jgi:hypothetical protein